MGIILNNNNITKMYYKGYSITRAYSCGGKIVYGEDPTPPTPTPYENQYFTIVANTTISSLGYDTGTGHIEYSYDSGSTWTQGNTGNVTIGTIPKGTKLMFKGDIQINFRAGGGRYSAEGNPMSLLYGDDFIGKTNFQNTSKNFEGLFQNCTGLTSIDNLVLVATQLKYNCYQRMFQGCTSLTSIPSNFLPATTLDLQCYYGMFQGCTSLTTIPSDLLPATTLGSGCYSNMFQGCTSLVNVPTNLLPSTTLAPSCYSNMFKGCTSLTNVPSLPADILTNQCYWGMFEGCTSLATVPSDLLSATMLADECYQRMFQGCTSLTNAPILGADVLGSASYFQMFYGCTNLSNITCLAIDISASNSTAYWVDGVASSGTFTKESSMNDWTTGINGIPIGWTIQNAS